MRGRPPFSGSPNVRWWPKAKTTRDGKVWVIKTAEEFRANGVDFAEKTIWNAIRCLKARGLLETERHRHPYKFHAGPVLWIRPGHYLLPSQGTTECPTKALQSALPGLYIEDSKVTEGTTGNPSAAAEIEDGFYGVVNSSKEEGCELKKASKEPGSGMAVIGAKKSGATVAQALALGGLKGKAHFPNLKGPLAVHEALRPKWVGLAPPDISGVRHSCATRSHVST